MEKMYRVLLANGSEEFCGKLGVALKQTNRYSVVGSACDGVRAICSLGEPVICATQECPYSSQMITF